ncbi:hypothetical protein BS78_04G033700 [Paspalum vaginatum]|nr:hypothetical protein BS78_04G033700 [Paspalum vaginatum]
METPEGARRACGDRWPMKMAWPRAEAGVAFPLARFTRCAVSVIPRIGVASLAATTSLGGSRLPPPRRLWSLCPAS